MLSFQELCNGWDLPDHESYSLQFSENNNQNYITDKNRNEVKNGSVLRLEHSPCKTASDILGKLNSGSPEEKVIGSLEKLSRLSRDMTFALEFINKQGLALIISQVNYSTESFYISKLTFKLVREFYSLFRDYFNINMSQVVK